MENINKIDRDGFIDVYVLKTLNEIKNKVKSNIILDREREEEVDRKMSLVLKDLINSNFKNLQQDPKGNMIYTLLPIFDELENKKVRLSLVLYYTALYYDNVDLLHDLLKENIKFEDRYSIKLQYLDKSISSRFDRATYIKYIKNCGEIFVKFIYSISKESKESKEKYISRFVKLFNLKYENIYEYISDTSVHTKLEFLFAGNNLDTFEDDTYILADNNQLMFIESCFNQEYNKETRQRLNHLIQKSNFSNFLCNFDLMMKLYTDEELVTLNYDISNAIDRFSQTEKSLNKIIDFLKIRPDLARDILYFSKEKFMKTDNYTLIEVCDYISQIYITEDTDFDLITKFMKPKAILKRVLGSYKRV